MNYYSHVLAPARRTAERFSGRLYTAPMIALYMYMYIYIYVQWASPRYYYIGFQYKFDFESITFAYTLGIVTFFALKQRITEYSQYFGWMIYIVIYIPSILSVAMQGFDSVNAYYINLSLTLSFLLIIWTPEILRQRKIVPVRRNMIMWYFIPFYLAAFSFYIYSYRDVMTMPSFGDIYDQRATFGAVNAGAIAAYVNSWLSTALNPYLIAVGVFDRSKRWALALGIVGQIAVFMGFAGKIMLAVTVVIILFAVFIVKNDQIKINRLVLAALALIVIPFFTLIMTAYEPEGVSMEVVALIYMRTLAMPGVMTGVYADVFSSFPLTYWSHANIINLVVDYPYNQPLGIVVGTYLVGGGGWNSNANFWATDGLAAFGMTGVIIMGAVIGILLSFANKIVTRDRLSFAAVMSVPFIMTLGNVSLFTSLISGGGLIIFLLIALGTPQTVRPHPQHASFRRPGPSSSRPAW